MCTRVNSLHETLHLWVFASTSLSSGQINIISKFLEHSRTENESKA